MDGKPNSSELTINTSIARRRAIMPTLARILKGKTSLHQTRALPIAKQKPSGGIKMFLLKGLIGCGAIYFSSYLEIWGGTKDSPTVRTKINEAITHINSKKIISEGVRTDFANKINKSMDFLKVYFSGLPDEFKNGYDKSEKYITDIMKGTKS